MRKEIFETDSPDFRIVCKIGHMGFLGNVWWSYFQRARRFKRYLFWGPTIAFWETFHECWYATEFSSLDQLRRRALDTFKMYDPRLYYRFLHQNSTIK